jgi:hypothetical protein
VVEGGSCFLSLCLLSTWILVMRVGVASGEGLNF